MQKEVAQRICAPAGKGDYGAFSVFCQYYAVPELLFDVPPSCFIPQPKGHVERAEAYHARRAPLPDSGRKALFPRREGKLCPAEKNTPQRAVIRLWRVYQAAAFGAIEAAGFSPTVRGETLDIPGFAAVCQELLKL